MTLKYIESNGKDILVKFRQEHGEEYISTIRQAPVKATLKIWG